MYKLQLVDGTIIDNLTMNGNNYIPEIPLDINVFTGNVEKIIITDENGNVEEINNCRIIFSEVSGKQSFVITSKTKTEVENEELKKRLADLTEIVLLGGV